MTCLQLTLPVSGSVPAVLTLPQPLTALALLDLEHAVAGTLGMMRRDLLNAGPFELKPIPRRDQDRYGRDLRVVVRNGRSLGDQLVSEGLARTWTGRREPWC